MKKRITALALAVVMVMGTVALAAGTEKSITVTPMDLNVNGYAVTPTKSNGEAAEVFAYDGATYAPIRYIAELLGIDVEWDKTAPNTAKLANVPGFVPPAASASLKDGSYTGVGTGKNGDVTVEVTVANGAISAVKVLSHSETPGISDPAIERIPAAIVDGQTVEVNAVAGATMTGDAILTAVKSCIQQAGGDPAAFGKKQETVSGKTVEYEADIVIVGAGAAGLMAALTASEAGAKVIVMEKAANALASNFAQCGGALDRNFGVLGNEFAGATSKLPGATFDFSTGFNLANQNLAFWIYGGLNVDRDGDRFINEKLVAEIGRAHV